MSRSVETVVRRHSDEKLQVLANFGQQFQTAASKLLMLHKKGTVFANIKLLVYETQ